MLDEEQLSIHWQLLGMAMWWWGEGPGGKNAEKKEGERKGEEGEGRRKDEEGRRGKLREVDIETFIQDIIYIFI